MSDCKLCSLVACRECGESWTCKVCDGEFHERCKESRYCEACNGEYCRECDDDEFDCDVCGQSNCSNCAQPVTCSLCPEAACGFCVENGHANIEICELCDDHFCAGCRTTFWCDACERMLCSQCETLKSCRHCGEVSCAGCATQCASCDDALCQPCSNSHSGCNCAECRVLQTCDSCATSFCSGCSSASLSQCSRCEESLCENCDPVSACASCGVNLCQACFRVGDSESQVCERCVDRRALKEIKALLSEHCADVARKAGLLDLLKWEQAAASFCRVAKLSQSQPTVDFDVQLTKGSIAQVISLGTLTLNPTLQITDLHAVGDIHSASASEHALVYAKLSDSIYCTTVTLSSEFNSLVARGDLQIGSIISLHSHKIGRGGEPQVVALLELKIVSQSTTPIGDPVYIETSTEFLPLEDDAVGTGRPEWRPTCLGRGVHAVDSVHPNVHCPNWETSCFGADADGVAVPIAVPMDVLSVTKPWVIGDPAALELDKDREKSPDKGVPQQQQPQTVVDFFAMSLGAMPAYESRSPEELRLEDEPFAAKLAATNEDEDETRGRGGPARLRIVTRGGLVAPPPGGLQRRGAAAAEGSRLARHQPDGAQRSLVAVTRDILGEFPAQQQRHFEFE